MPESCHAGDPSNTCYLEGAFISLLLSYVPPVCSMDHSAIIQPSNWARVQAELQAQAARGSTGPATKDVTTITGLAGTSKWDGGILGPQGRIYGTPIGDSRVLILDPAINTADVTTISGLGAGALKWTGGVLAFNGRIYNVARSDPTVLIIDPNSNTVDNTAITGLGGAADKWLGGILAPNGRIYASGWEACWPPTERSTVFPSTTRVP